MTMECNDEQEHNMLEYSSNVTTSCTAKQFMFALNANFSHTGNHMYMLK